MRYFLVILVFLSTGKSLYAQNKTNETDSSQSFACIAPDTFFKITRNPFCLKQAYVPAALITTGVMSATLFKNTLKYKLVQERNEHLGNFQTNIDDYMQYAPIPIAYGLDALGVKSRNDIANRSLILLKGELLMLATVNALKYTTKELRPDGGNRYSFPSGHTAQAFAAATFLTEEYKHRFPWMPYVAYGMAGSTGLLRMANNRHFIGDVLVGAGLGILSMKLAYWTHQYRWGKQRKRC